MGRIRPYVMSIAGFDPCAGAGVLADIKTIEQVKAYGFAVITANTNQNEDRVITSNWIPVDQITRQMQALFESYKITYFKIGIVQNEAMFLSIRDFILNYNPKAQITWDPVLKASSGEIFFEGDLNAEKLLAGISLVTPNVDEFNALFASDDEKLKRVSEKTKIYLKGGHREAKKGLDTVYDGLKIRNYRPKLSDLVSKHGSGCVLSSALTAYLARGFSFHQSCLKSKRYIESVLSSNHTKLGYHKL